MTLRDPKAPGLIDILAGRWLRTLRSSQRMSREELAYRAGVTPQQIHKYECGYNRIAAGRLAQLSVILGVSPDDFFEGADVLREALLHLDAETQQRNFKRDLCDLLIAYIQAGSPSVRRDILDLVRSAANKRHLKDRSRVAFVIRDAFPRGRPRQVVSSLPSPAPGSYEARARYSRSAA